MAVICFCVDIAGICFCVDMAGICCVVDTAGICCGVDIANICSGCVGAITGKVLLVHTQHNICCCAANIHQNLCGKLGHYIESWLQ